MPQTESDDEAAAAAIVSDELGVPALTFFDTLGAVDYIFEIDGQRAALEVTRFTDPVSTKAWKAWIAHDDGAPYLAPQLRQSWLVTVDSATTFRGLVPLLMPALVTLELLNLTEYEQLDADWWAARPALTEAVAILERAHVVHAQARDDVDGPTQLLFMTSSTSSGSGPGPAAHAIEQFITDTADNLRKLAASSAAHLHLWVWVDHLSAGIVELPLHRSELPDFPITLPDEITELWICHESTQYGWRFAKARGWTAFGTAPL